MNLPGFSTSFFGSLPVLKDYEGGTNPVIAIILLGALIGGAITLVAYLVYQVYLVFRFNQVCTQAKVTPEEVGMLRNFLRRMHVEEPLKVVTQKGKFDSFMNRVSHYYQGLPLSEQDLANEELVFAQMRQKFHLQHHFGKHRLRTSRCLPLGFPINLMCIDQETQNVFTFPSKILESNEFFLGIQPPNAEISQAFYHQKRPHLEVGLVREKDAEYLFDSRLARAVDHPQTMWYIDHSNELTRVAPLPPIQIPAILMLAELDVSGKVEEYTVELQNLSNKGCSFVCEQRKHPFDQGPKVLLSFELEAQSFTCRGRVVHAIKKAGSLLYRLNFEHLSVEDDQHLLRFMLEQKRQQRLSHAAGALSIKDPLS